MSISPIDIRLRSGRRLASVQELKADIIKALHNAITNAYRETWRLFRPTIAKKTGTFRLNIDTAFEAQLARVQGREKFQIRFPEILGSRPDYGKYHIFGPTGESRTTRPYADPTTKGTKPLNEFTFMDTLEDLIPKYLRLEFSALGLNWKNFVRVL